MAGIFRGEQAQTTSRGRVDARLRPLYSEVRSPRRPFLHFEVQKQVRAMIAEVLQDAEERMNKSIEALARELAAIRTGHAHTGLVEHVKVEYYGAETPINQMA